MSHKDDATKCMLIYGLSTRRMGKCDYTIVCFGHDFTNVRLAKFNEDQSWGLSIICHYCKLDTCVDA